MDLDQIISSDAWAEFEALLADNITSGPTWDHFAKHLRELVDRHEWYEVFPKDDKREFNRRADVFRGVESRRLYMARNLEQLLHGNFAIWVYRHGGSHRPTPEHVAWDRIVLSSDHPFWRTHFPPNGFNCSCSVIGARSMAGAMRRGGDPSIRLPSGWDRPLPGTGVPDGLHRLFIGQSTPTSRMVLPFVLDGTARGGRGTYS